MTIFDIPIGIVTMWKVSKYRVFSGPYFPAFGLNTGKCRPEKLRIWTLFTQWVAKWWLSLEPLGIIACRLQIDIRIIVKLENTTKNEWLVLTVVLEQTELVVGVSRAYSEFIYDGEQLRNFFGTQLLVSLECAISMN